MACATPSLWRNSRITSLATALAEYTAEHMLTDPAPDAPEWSAEAVEPYFDELAPPEPRLYDK
jgi:hypothetical protein